MTFTLSHLSIAWSSVLGFHHGSQRITTEAEVRLRPTPPALKQVKNICGREGGKEGGRDGWMDGGRKGGREKGRERVNEGASQSVSQ